MNHRNYPEAVVTRHVEVALIPDGSSYLLPADAIVQITQALGGSFTLYFEGRLLRLDGADADAIGRQREDAPDLPGNLTDAQIEALIWDQLRTCYDPEIPINIVDLGLVYRLAILPAEDGRLDVELDMTVTAPGCGMGTVIAQDAGAKIDSLPRIGRITIEVVYDPPWDRSMMSDAARLQTGLM
jgi:probable FeS assembly SUF system protein SufT